MGLDDPPAGRGPRPGEPDPLRDLVAVLADEPMTATRQVVGNLLVFAAALSLLVETAQYVLRLDRVSSVDDVLLDAAGAGLAALAARRWWRTGEGALRKESG